MTRDPYETISEFLFPTHIIRSDRREYSAVRTELIAACYEARTSDPIGVAKANVNGWQSRDDVFTQEPRRRWLSWLQEQMDWCLEKEFQPSKKVKFVICNAWMNISGTHAYAACHVHPQALFSGVFYVQTPPNCGSITFYDPKEFQAYRELQIKSPALRAEHRLNPNYECEPIEGRMLLFPAWLPHDVGMNHSTGDRISISFNIIDFPKGAD